MVGMMKDGRMNRCMCCGCGVRLDACPCVVCCVLGVGCLRFE